MNKWGGGICNFCSWVILEGVECLSNRFCRVRGFELFAINSLRVTRDPAWCKYSIKRLSRWLKKIEKMEKENDLS